MYRLLCTIGSISICSIFIFLVFAFPASAHFMWINAGKCSSQQPTKINLNIGWGHSFANPVGNVLRDLDHLEKIVLFDPTGNEHRVVPANEIDFKLEKPKVGFEKKLLERF